MKTAHIVSGLLLAAGINLLVGAPAQDVQITAPARKVSPSLTDKSGGPAPVGPAYDSSRHGGLEDTVEIVSVTEQKPDPSGRRKVTIRVHYALIHYPKGVLSLGFNLKSATQFVRVTDQPVMAGSEDIELSAAIVPVTWPKDQPFKLSVSLSAEPHPNQWSLLAAVTQAMTRPAAPSATH